MGDDDDAPFVTADDLFQPLFAGQIQVIIRLIKQE